MRRHLLPIALALPSTAHAGMPTGKVQITAIAVEVEPTTAKGKPWDTSKDSNAPPDLVIELRANGKKLAKCESIDSVEAYCQLDETVELTEDSRFEIEVTDDDGMLDDKIGTGSISRLLTEEPGAIAFATNGRIRRATITVTPVPSWFAAHRPGLIGFGLGVLGALGLIGALRSKLLVPDPPPPPMPRCAHCGATVRKRDRRCFNCGAAQ